jgi:thioesterase domain-containing protein
MAELYLAAIREVRPQGPYRLLGYSMGSKIAFEIACRLEKAGEQVELLALLDIPAVVPEGFAEESGSEVPAEIRELPDFDHEIAQRHLDVLRANRTASLGWAPAEYGGAAVLFVAEEGTGAGAEDPTLGWSGPARGGVMVVSTPGDHFSMLRAPHVQGLVEKLSQFKSKDREMACLLR